jgi:hypothetical protein
MWVVRTWKDPCLSGCRNAHFLFENRTALSHWHRPAGGRPVGGPDT